MSHSFEGDAERLLRIWEHGYIPADTIVRTIPLLFYACGSFKNGFQISGAKNNLETPRLCWCMRALYGIWLSRALIFTLYASLKWIHRLCVRGLYTNCCKFVQFCPMLAFKITARLGENNHIFFAQTKVAHFDLRTHDGELRILKLICHQSQSPKCPLCVYRQKAAPPLRGSLP